VQLLLLLLLGSNVTASFITISRLVPGGVSAAFFQQRVTAFVSCSFVSSCSPCFLALLAGPPSVAAAVLATTAARC
jgi:hypothetical protein